MDQEKSGYVDGIKIVFNKTAIIFIIYLQSKKRNCFKSLEIIMQKVVKSKSVV